MRYTLKNDGYETFKKICQGRKWVGRVFKHADGHYVGMIGRTEAKGASETEAFREVVSKHLGFENAGALAEHNRGVRAANNARRAPTRALVRAFQNADVMTQSRMISEMIDNLLNA